MDKADVKPWFTKYCSTSRTMYRGCWFFDFLGVLLSEVASDKDSKMSKIAEKAYKKALAPHHGWMLQKAALIAMKAVKRRDKFIDSICKEQQSVDADYNEEKFYEDFATLGKQSASLAEKLWDFCKQNGLDKLP